MSASGRAVVAVGSARTADVEPSERLEYWEYYNAAALVGLRCSTYAVDGLLAQQENYDAGNIKIADIRANAHVIERTQRLVEAQPKDAIFASVLTEGSAFFYSADGCVPVRAGQVVIYDTVSPYLFAFGSAMRQVLIDVPREMFEARFGPASFERPIVADLRAGGAGPLSAFLNRSISAQKALANCSHTSLLDAVGSLSGSGEDVSLARLQQARSFIEAQILDPRLNAEQVADVVGVTTRHLNRAFAEVGTSLSRVIREQRLIYAVDDLQQRVEANIADVAAKWGFSSHAQFTTAVKRHYGVTPSQLRQQHCDDHSRPVTEGWPQDSSTQ